MGSTGSTGTLPSIDPFRTTSHRIASRPSFFLDPFLAPSCHVASWWMFNLVCPCVVTLPKTKTNCTLKNHFQSSSISVPFSNFKPGMELHSLTLSWTLIYFAKQQLLEVEGAVKLIKNQVQKKSLFLYKNKNLHNLLAQLQSTQPLLSS